MSVFISWHNSEIDEGRKAITLVEKDSCPNVRVTLLYQNKKLSTVLLTDNIVNRIFKDSLVYAFSVSLLSKRSIDEIP